MAGPLAIRLATDPWDSSRRGGPYWTSYGSSDVEHVCIVHLCAASDAADVHCRLLDYVGRLEGVDLNQYLSEAM